MRGSSTPPAGRRMMPAGGCHAAWYELNVSAPDDCVSACCYYAGAKDPWSDEFRTVEDYWNSPNMVRIRAINADPGAARAGGCTDCFFFKNRGPQAVYAPPFESPPSDLSPAQHANWLAAVDDYRHGRTTLTSTPLRYYVNFGFACNLSCIMCHQVPRREANRRQASADALLRWKDGFRRAFDVSVIGGEPFALPEAIKFIRAVAADPDLDAVTLTILTNGTVHQKHLDTLLQKRKVRLVVSLDALGDAFEHVRIGASWERVERNILEFLAVGRAHARDWVVQSSCLLMKSVVPRLADFCAWSVRHGIVPSFYDFITARGIEQVFEEENVVARPEVLADVPDWEDQFTRGAALLRAAGWEAPAGQLDAYRATIGAALASRRATRAHAARVRAERWRPLYRWAVEAPGEGLQMNLYGDAATVDAVAVRPEGLLFQPTHLSDHLATPFQGVAGRWLRLACRWPSAEGPRPPCRFTLQDERCATLEHADEQGGGPEDATLERHYAVPVGVGAVRVVMTALTLESVYLPVEIALEEATG